MQDDISKLIRVPALVEGRAGQLACAAERIVQAEAEYAGAWAALEQGPPWPND